MLHILHILHILYIMHCSLQLLSDCIIFEQDLIFPTTARNRQNILLRLTMMSSFLTLQFSSLKSDNLLHLISMGLCAGSAEMQHVSMENRSNHDMHNMRYIKYSAYLPYFAYYSYDHSIKYAPADVVRFVMQSMFRVRHQRQHTRTGLRSKVTASIKGLMFR
jgi:hypothetical protein